MWVEAVAWDSRFPVSSWGAPPAGFSGIEGGPDVCPDAAGGFG